MGKFVFVIMMCKYVAIGFVIEGLRCLSLTFLLLGPNIQKQGRELLNKNFARDDK
jgi:hypothetical protein